MSFPAGGHHRNEPPHFADPLTDSGVHRLSLGTQVRLHLHGDVHIDCGLLAIRDVTNWNDLAAMVVRGQPIEIMASRRRILGGGVVLWAEVLSDPAEEPTAQA